MTKASVWGANGYIGQHLLMVLMEKGWQITCYDIHSKLEGGFKLPYRQIDIIDPASFEDIQISNEECVFFFIGLTGTLASIENYKSFIQVNELGLLNFLNRMKALKTKAKIVFPSTRLVYRGKQNIALNEDDEKEFKTIYASSKYNGELYLKMFSELYDIKYTVFRICVPYGNLLLENYSYGTIGFFLSQAEKGQNITLYGDGSLKRTFTHVEDICLQIEDICKHESSVNECFNTCGETYSLKDVALLIAKKYNVECDYVSWTKNALLLESGDTIFNSSKIEALLQTKPKHSLEEWIFS